MSKKEIALAFARWRRDAAQNPDGFAKPGEKARDDYETLRAYARHPRGGRK